MKKYITDAFNGLFAQWQKTKQIESESAGIRIKLLQQAESDPSLSQYDMMAILAIKLFGDEGHRKYPWESHNESLPNPLKWSALGDGNEILSCRYTNSNGRRLHSALFFKSWGIPTLAMRGKSVDLVFPECRFFVFAGTQDQGDFHERQGHPRIELFAPPTPDEALRGLIKNVPPEEPLPNSFLGKHLFTNEASFYGYFILEDECSRFVASPKVAGYEGEFIVLRFRELFKPDQL